MRGAVIVLGAFVLALLGAPALLHGDEWEQVPSDSGHRSLPGAPAGNQSAMACGLVGTLVEQTAKMRDQGASEESQLATVDNPKGKLYQLTNGSMLSADTAATLRAGIHREIAYVYEHREMTPAQLSAHARETCGNPE